MATRIKICGIKDSDDALMCSELGADALGFIFYPKSPRYILPKLAGKIIDRLPCFVNKVGVFVDEKESVVKEIAGSVGIDTLQFHGSESASYCRRFRKHYKVMKSFFPKDKNVLNTTGRYNVDGILLDIPFHEKSKKPKSVLGSRLVRKIADTIPDFILSGGLSVNNVQSLVRKLHPYAVDVARGVERFPGKKDKSLVKNFIKEVRKVR